MRTRDRLAAASVAIGLSALAGLFAKDTAPRRKVQDPVRPFPYEEREIRFRNANDGTVLRGTLTVPRGAGPFPAAILVSGSGPQDRDEEMLGHRPFLVVADFLTRRGYAVLRYDDRHFGMPAEKGWRYTTADFALDAKAALETALAEPGIDRSFVGFIGHSEGGVVAPMVASGDARVAFIVSLAGMGLSGLETGKRQWVSMAADSRAASYSTAAFDLIVAEPDKKTREKKLRALHRSVYGNDAKARAEFRQTLPLVSSEWNRFMLAHDPASSWKKVSCPVLSLNGSYDIQVPAAENQGAIAAALREANNGDVTVTVVPGANHLFQTVSDGNAKPYAELIAEYASCEETFAPAVLETIAGWLDARRPR